MNYSTLKHKNSGYSLIEFGLTLALATLFLGYFLPMINDFRLDREKKALERDHVNQFNVLINAVGSWASDNYAEIADDTSGEVSVAALKADGYLPAEFAFQYSNDVAQDILGMAFKVYWNKKLIEWGGMERQTVRALITVDQPINWQGYPENLVPSKFANIESADEHNLFVGNWNSHLAIKGGEKDLVGGRLKANSHMIVGTNQSWKFELDTADFNIPQREYQRAVFFWGWPDINGFGGGLEPPGSIEPADQYSACVPGRIQHQAYLNVSHQGHATYQISNGGNQPSVYCPAGKPKILVDLTTSGGSTDITNIPGFGTVFATTKATVVSTLGSLGGNCAAKAQSWCQKISGAICDENNQYHDAAEGKKQACNVTPLYQYSASLNISGSEYAFYDLYSFGAYSFGTVQGINYIVANRPLGSSNPTGGNHHIMCCPLDTPNL